VQRIVLVKVRLESKDPPPPFSIRRYKDPRSDSDTLPDPPSGNHTDSDRSSKGL